MPVRATQHEPRDRSTAVAEPRAPATPAPAMELQRAIGNRATGRLLQRRLGGHHRRGQLIQDERGELYEILHSDFNDFMQDWSYRVRSVSSGKKSKIGDWEKGYSFTSATQLIEKAIADKSSIRMLVNRLPETRVNELAGFHAWLDKVAPLMGHDDFAYLAAGIMVVSRHVPKARREALRQISAELGDKEVAMRMIKKPVQAIVVPRDKQMTELSEFASLKTSDSGKGPGKTFDGREWAHVRGVGNVQANGKVYAAITEENILGGVPDPKVFAEKKDAKGNVVTPAGAVAGGYDTGYSTTTHEFAHVLHRNGLSADDKKVISKAYAQRRTDTSGSKAKLLKKWVDGPRISPVAPKAWKDAGWTDKKWLDHIAGLTDDARRPYECYASQNEMEYFAQLSNAYLGTNTGRDPTTLQPRRNGRAWIEANEPKEMLDLLDRLYRKKTVNDIKKDGSLIKGGLCANPAKPPPAPTGPPPKGKGKSP